MFQRTLIRLRKATITMPQLSPTHTKAKIVQWSVDIHQTNPPIQINCYNPLFILQCSPDLITPGFRKYDDHEPLMIVEAHDEGILSINPSIKMNEWYDVGTVLGTIDDGDDDPADDSEWLWQAYNHVESMPKE